jgi:hypothetical protein
MSASSVPPLSVHVQTVVAEPTPVQRAAWDKLWRILTAPDGPPSPAGDPTPSARQHANGGTETRNSNGALGGQTEHGC